MPYNSKSSLIADQELRVQEVCIRFSDLGLYSVSGNDVTVELGETLASVPVALHMDNSGPNCLLIAQSAVVISGSSVTVTLGAPFAASDSLVLKFIVS